jgi:cytoskeletal protein RodZ
MQISMPQQQQDQNKTTPISNYSMDIETGDQVAHNKTTSQSIRNGTTRRRQMWYILGVVSVFVLVAVVLVAVLVVGGAGGQQLTPEQQQLHEIVNSISSQKDLQNSASPQYMAYNWLVHKDTFSNDNISREQVVQRYVLAVFYYATMGHQSWVASSNWLQGNECLGNWFGVSCSDQGHVRTLKFGKSSQRSLVESCHKGQY